VEIRDYVEGWGAIHSKIYQRGNRWHVAFKNRGWDDWWYDITIRGYRSRERAERREAKERRKRVAWRVKRAEAMSFVRAENERIDAAGD
jgi:hypothetical protein